MSLPAPSTAWIPAAILVAMLTTRIVGCGRALNDVPVKGRVSYQGQPIAHGALMFFPPHGRAVVAPTNEAGEYVVQLAPGQYDVTVNASVQLPAGWKEGDPVPPQETVLPTLYTTRVKTPLKATVAASGTQSIDFVLP